MSKHGNRTRRIYGIILISFVIIWIGSVSLQMLSNRHNAWNDGDVYAFGANGIHKGKIGVNIVKILGNG